MSVEQEVREAVAALVADFGAGRVDAYFERMADTATFVFHSTPQRLDSRAAYRALWDRWETEYGFRVLACSSQDQRVDVLGNDAAVLSHSVRTRVGPHAGEEELEERETIVLARRGDRWWVVHEHLSPAG